LILVDLTVDCPQSKHRFYAISASESEFHILFAFTKIANTVFEMSEGEDSTGTSVEEITEFLKKIYAEKLHENIDNKKPEIEEIINEIQDEIASKKNEKEIARHNINALKEMTTICAEYLGIDFKRNSLIMKNGNLFNDLNFALANVEKTMTTQYLFDEKIIEEEETIQKLEGEIEKVSSSLKCRIQEKIRIEVDIDELIPRCEICLERFDHNDHWESCINICGHKFGSSCLIKVLECSGRCPKCNKKFENANILTLF
jgi:hypothetical protein